MIINVAGAGAGKTTGLAKEIIDKYEKTDSNKKIYCVAFTNNAVKSIVEKLLIHFDIIPNNIIVCTIHSFLYQEFISPYYYIMYDKHYGSISTIELPSKAQFKNYKLAELDKKSILHIESMPEKAKWVVVKKVMKRVFIKLAEILFWKFLSHIVKLYLWTKLKTLMDI